MKIDEQGMTDTVATRSFESILAEVRQVIGAERYEIWFAKVRMISLFRGVVTLGVPNLVYRDWITENYLPALEEASERSMGARLRFELKVERSIDSLLSIAYTPPPLPAGRPACCADPSIRSSR